MSTPVATHHGPDRIVVWYYSGSTTRSRSVGARALTGTVLVPPVPHSLLADWEREIALHLRLEPGDVEALPLARARRRWQGYGQCVHAAEDWARSLGLQDVLVSSDVALMACRGARYHHDGAQYGGAAFCNIFLSEDKGLDLHFRATGQRIPLIKGTVVVFDTAQPHAVLDRHAEGFYARDFPAERDCSLFFLTWELPIETHDVAQVLRIEFDIDPQTAVRPDVEQVFVNGKPADVCPESGEWRTLNAKNAPNGA